MAYSAQMPYPDPDRDSSTTKWVVVFVLLSLLAHALLILALILIARFVPAPKLQMPPLTSPSVSLSLMPTPQPVQLPQQKPLFLPTAPDAGAKPNPQALIESDNDSRLKSESRQARKPDGPLPDIVSKRDQAMDFHDTPLVQSNPRPEVASTPPTPKQQQPKQPPTPPQPKTEQTPPQKPTPQPAKPLPKPPNPEVTKNTVDSETGLPVLPPIIAPTIAPQTTVDPNQQPRKASSAQPPPSFQLNKSDISGAAGAPGDNSPEARATELGRYKAKVYRGVGSIWYTKVGAQRDLLPVGLVHIEFTIYADGTVTTRVLDGGNSTMQMLLSISMNSIREAAPFDKFDDHPGMRQELIKEQGGDGSSYTDDFTFSVY